MFSRRVTKADTLLDLIQRRLKKYFAEAGIVSPGLKHEQLAAQLSAIRPSQKKDKQEKIDVTYKILNHAQSLQRVINDPTIEATEISDTPETINFMLYCIEQSIVAKNKQYTIMAMFEPSEFSIALDDIVKELSTHCKCNNDYQNIAQEKADSLKPEISEQNIRSDAKQERNRIRANMEYDESCLTSPNAHIDHSDNFKKIKTSRKNEKTAIQILRTQQKVYDNFLKALPIANNELSHATGFAFYQPAREGDSSDYAHLSRTKNDSLST